jgi:hypothetical protein
MTSRLKPFMPLFTTICRFHEVRQIGDQTALQENEEGAIHNLTGDLSNDRRGFLTILDNILTVGVWARGEKHLSGLSLNQQAPQKELEGVRKMAHRRTSPRRSGDSESAGKNIWTSPGPTLKKAKNKRGSIFNCLMFINVFRELSKHTTYASHWGVFILH